MAHQVHGVLHVQVVRRGGGVVHAFDAGGSCSSSAVTAIDRDSMMTMELDRPANTHEAAHSASVAARLLHGQPRPWRRLLAFQERESFAQGILNSSRFRSDVHPADKLAFDTPTFIERAAEEFRSEGNPSIRILVGDDPNPA